jgi:hypothetical protein
MLAESSGSAFDAPAEPRTNTLVNITHLRNMTSPVNDLALIASSKQHLRKNKLRPSDLTTHKGASTMRKGASWIDDNLG